MNARTGPPGNGALRLGALAAGLALVAALAGDLATGAPQEKAPTITPVSGRSWLRHLNADIEATAMGQRGGISPPPATARVEPRPFVEDRSRRGFFRALTDGIASLFRRGERGGSEALNEPFILTGADLYRLNCRSCHGVDGSGSPPEVESLLDPVRGTSPALIRRRMEERGLAIDEDFAGELAAEAMEAIRERLAGGGEKMPAFRHLEGVEIDALIAYLKELAGVPGDEIPDLRVTQPVARVGEHLVKGTCRVCHDATGPGGGRMMMMRGGIPSLASLVSQRSPREVTRKVLRGSSAMMGMMGRTRMPRFPYLTEEEVLAAYLFLANYPPRP